MPVMRFLIDENAPHDVVNLLRGRGHVAEYVGEAFAKSSPDSLLLLAAELHGHVVTIDRDFKQLLRQVPAGSRSAVDRRAGRISFSCREDQTLPRLQELLGPIEILHQHAQDQGKRFIMQISATSYTVSG
jgi:hypothetical protein